MNNALFQLGPQMTESWQWVYLLIVSLAIPMSTAGLVFSGGSVLSRDFWRMRPIPRVLLAVTSLFGFALLVPQWGGIIPFFLVVYMLPALGAPIEAIVVSGAYLVGVWCMSCYCLVTPTKGGDCERIIF